MDKLLKLNARLILSIFIVLMVAFALYIAWTLYEGKKATDNRIENRLIARLTKGDCQGAYTLLSTKAQDSNRYVNFRKYCEDLKDKKLVLVGSTGDIDLDADHEQSYIYSIQPDIDQGKYIVIGTLILYKSNEVTDVYFTNSKDCDGEYSPIKCSPVSTTP